MSERTDVESSACVHTGSDRDQPAGSSFPFLAGLTARRLLQADEEVELAAAARTGDRAARARLVESNMRLVVKLARRYTGSALPLEDLVQEGAIGLLIACERYDPGKGYRFSTYATHWIKQSINRAIDSKSRTIRLPTHVAEALRRINRAATELRQASGEEPTVEQISAHIGMSVRRIRGYMRAQREPVSLDGLMGRESDRFNLGAVVSDPGATDPAQRAVTADRHRVIAELLATLSEREQEVVRRRFGFADDPPHVLQEIGSGYGISRERVRQIEAAALRRLRVQARSRRLQDYL